MKRKLNYKTWKRIRAKTVDNPRRNNNGFLVTINTLLTSFVSFAALFVAIASYRTSQKQTEIANSLAQLEFAKNDVKFLIMKSEEKSGFQQNHVLIRHQFPLHITVSPFSGVKDIVNVNGELLVFLEDIDTKATCVLAIRGAFSNEEVDRIEFIDNTRLELERLIDNAFYKSLTVRGFDVVLSVLYTDLYDRMITADLGLDGLRMEATGVRKNNVVVYSGTWSGGKGFYLDKSDPDALCPKLAKDIREMIDLTGGYPGDRGTDNLPPTLRYELMAP
jgi:hypothetical protein